MDDPKEVEKRECQNAEIVQSQMTPVHSQRAPLLPQPLASAYGPPTASPGGYMPCSATTGAFWPVQNQNAATSFFNQRTTYMTPPPPPPGVASYLPPAQQYYQPGQQGVYQGPTGLAAMNHMLQNQYREQPSLTAEEVAEYTRILQQNDPQFRTSDLEDSEEGILEAVQNQNVIVDMKPISQTTEAVDGGESGAAAFGGFACKTDQPSFSVATPAVSKTENKPAEIKLTFGTSLATTTAPTANLSEAGKNIFSGALGQSKTEGFAKTNVFGFAGSGNQSFNLSFSPATQSAGHKSERGKSRSESEGAEGADDSNYEPNVEFKPVVTLPDIVEVCTGEENEERLFMERAKLFRFVPETQEFKERGVGDLKILKHKETGKIRLLMRRDQVLKLCANHNITGEMKLTPMAKSDRAYTWLCNDYSEEELKIETLAAKFKSTEVAEKFRDKFINYVGLLV